MARKKDRAPKANPQSRRRSLLKNAGMEPTEELLKMPWADFEEKMKGAGVETSKPKRTPRKSGGTKKVTVSIGGDVVVPANVKPPSPKDENKKPRTKPKPKKKKPLSTPTPPPPPNPSAASPSPPSPPKPLSATPKATPNPFAGIFGSGSEPKKKKSPKTYFGKKNPKGQMGAMVAQQRQSPHNLENTRREVANWLGRVGQRVKREVAATVSDVNRIGAGRTKVSVGQPSRSGPQMTNVRGASATPQQQRPVPRPSAPRAGAGPQMTNVRSGPSMRGATQPRVALSSQSRPDPTKIMRLRDTTPRSPLLGPGGYTPLTREQNRAAARAGVNAILRGPAQGRRASAVDVADIPPRRPRAPVSREIRSVKTSAFRVSAAHGWSPTSARFVSPPSGVPPLPGTGGRVGLYGYLRENRRQVMGGGNFRDRSPVVSDIKKSPPRRPSSMSGAGMGSGSPQQPTTPTGRTKKTSYKPQPLGRPVNAERAASGRVPGTTVTRSATPASSVPASSTTRPTRSTDALGNVSRPAKVVYRSEQGNYATRSGRELSFFGPEDRTPRLVTPVSPKGSSSPTRLPTKKIDFPGVARDIITDLESPWSSGDLKRRPTTKEAGSIARAAGVSVDRAKSYAEGRAISRMESKYPNPFMSRSSWLGTGAQNVNLPATMGSKTGRAKTGLVSALKKRGLLGLAGGAVGTGVGVAVDVLASPDKAYAPMSPKARAEQRVFLREREASRKRSLAAAKKVFPTFAQPNFRRSK